MSFTVSTGEMHTKAVADGSNIDILYYEVYGDNVLTASAPINKGYVKNRNANGDFVVNVPLVKEMTYNFIFWAQVDGKNHYDVSDLRKVKIVSYTDESANDETRAAFYAYQQVKVTGASDRNVSVVLKRPFAQLNFGTSTLNYGTANKPGSITLTSSSVTVNRVANVFNTITGRGEGGVEVTFKPALTPNGKKDETDQLLETKNSKYHWLGMNYLIVSGGDSDTVVLDATFQTNKGDVDLHITNVSIRKNYRTNIVGNLLTTNSMFTIVVDEVFDKPDKDYDDEGNKLN